MSRILSIHSFRGGTGKSNLAANIGTILAKRGLRVGIIDTDVQSPGVHALFGFKPSTLQHTLNDFLFRGLPVEAAAYSIAELAAQDGSRTHLNGLPLWLIPASIRMNEIAQIVQQGYDVNLLTEGFRHLSSALALDWLIIDTHPGLNEETLLSIALSNVMGIVLRPDEQDYQGTAVTVDIARRLEVPRLRLIVNKALSRYNFAHLRHDIGETYGIPVSGVLPLSEDVIMNASADVFVALYPEHPWTILLAQIADDLISEA